MKRPGVMGLSAVFSGLVLLLMSAVFIRDACATPLFAVQASERCDTCHMEPDRSDPKWVEENTPLRSRKCRLSCNVCHVNPSGGMLRNDTGMYFGTKTLPLNGISEEFQKYIDQFRSNKYITLGGDFRFMSLYEEDREDNPALFPMQADLYASAELLKHLTFMSQFGLERGGNASVREASAIVGNMPYNTYLKAGKMLPPYGHRIEDHTAFIRSKLGLDHSQSDSYYAGIEAGAEPLLGFARAAFFNEDLTPATNTESSRRGGSGVIGWHGLWLQLGASYLDIINYETDSALTVDRRAYGVFGALRPNKVPYLERLTYLFEFDRRVDDHIDSSADSTDYTSTIMFNELSYRAMKGLNLKVRYEVYDPDEDYDDEQGLKRYVAGADFYPYPFTEINVQYRINKEDEDEVDDNEFLVIGKVWF